MGSGGIMVQFHLRRFEAWAISFTPLCPCPSEEILKAVGPNSCISSRLGCLEYNYLRLERTRRFSLTELDGSRGQNSTVLTELDGSYRTRRFLQNSTVLTELDGSCRTRQVLPFHHAIVRCGASHTAVECRDVINSFAFIHNTAWLY